MGWNGPMTGRQYLTWMVWFDLQLNHPNKIENYLMSIACEIRRSYVKHPGRVTVQQMKLKFEREEVDKTTIQESEQVKKNEIRTKSELAKSRALARMTVPVTFLQKNADGSVVDVTEKMRRRYPKLPKGR